MRDLRMVGGPAGWFLVALFLGGCLSDAANVQLRTVPQATDDRAIGKVYVGPLLDMRQGGTVDTTILGTVRGGMGNPIVRIRHAGGAGEFVRDQVINAARTCQIIADPTPEAVGVRREGNVWVLDKPTMADRVIVVGVINQLTVDTGYTRGILIDLSLELLEPKRMANPRVWNAVVVDSAREAGLALPAADLKRWLGESVEKATARTLASPDFATALKAR